MAQLVEHEALHNTVMPFKKKRKIWGREGANENNLFKNQNVQETRDQS
jgi:hypothetical protein